jgi:hypothetical protein
VLLFHVNVQSPSFPLAPLRSILWRSKALKLTSLKSASSTLFHFPYAASPFLATLTKTAGCTPTIPNSEPSRSTSSAPSAISVSKPFPNFELGLSRSPRSYNLFPGAWSIDQALELGTFVCTQGTLCMRSLEQAIHSSILLRDSMLPRNLMRIVALLIFSGLLPFSAYSQQTAVLIGTATFSRHDDSRAFDQPQLGIRYGTVLIATDGSTASVRATLPDIVVPHRTDWWRVGVRFDCQAFEVPDAEQPSADAPKQWWVEQLYVSRIGEVPQVFPPYPQTTVACPAALVADFKAGKNLRASHDAAGSSDDSFLQPCLFSTIAISALTSNFISVRNHSANSEECEARGFRWTDGAYTQRLEDPAPVTYSDLLGQKGWDEYNRVLIESGKNLANAGFNCELSEEELKAKEPQPQTPHDIGWYLDREKGKWTAVASYQPGNAACQYGGTLSLPLPKNVTIENAMLRPEWASLERQIKGLRDAFTSPAGDLLVAVRESQVEIYALKERKIGKRLLSLPADRVVMVQWAGGKYVDAWVAAFQEWQNKTLPAATISKPQDMP